MLSWYGDLMPLMTIAYAERLVVNKSLLVARLPPAKRMSVLECIKRWFLPRYCLRIVYIKLCRSRYSRTRVLEWKDAEEV